MLCAVTELNSVDVSTSTEFYLVMAQSSCPGEIWSMTRFHESKNSRQTHTTNDNDILPHTVQELNERTSTEVNLVSAQSTAHEPPEDDRKYGPKHVGASFLKCFEVF